jgi:hypothetical protein
MEISPYIPIVAIVISLAAFAISSVTMWLTLLRKGTVCMTQPTVIFFGPDGGHKKSAKIFFRTLLYSTSKKGRVIENLYIRVKRGESQQNFNIWVYGSSELNRGSGLFVGETGIATNHHFLLPTDTEAYEFKSGEYILEVYVRLIGDKENKLLHKTALSISSQEAAQLKEGDKGIYFDWGPDSNRYHSHIDSKPPRGKDGMDVFLQEILKSK